MAGDRHLRAEEEEKNNRPKKKKDPKKTRHTFGSYLETPKQKQTRYDKIIEEQGG